ncbi:MAG TPA: alpha/beta hydrolase [Solirubrobacteraceae bacterium]|nr:alpha/beta hydrolase [Solirubrobacteraceae bacterium]
MPSQPPALLLRAGYHAIGALFALPDSLLGLLAGPVPAEAAGLEPDAWLVARLSERTRLPAGELPPEQMRARFELLVKPFSARRLPAPQRSDHELAGPAGPIAARLYLPAEAPERGPLLVYYHGGGWVQGSIASHGLACRLLAHLSGVRILSIEYRLAPEHPFPAAADDAFAAYAQVAERHAEFGADPLRLAVGGDSAGGNLAAVTAQVLRGESTLPAPRAQVLIYPALDMSSRRESRRLFGERYLLTEQSMSWYEDQYAPDPALRTDPRVSPLCAPDLGGLAPAYIATCLADPLRDEGEEYARRLREAGVAVALQRHPLVHGFVNQTVTRSAYRAVAAVAGALRQAFA